jgi:hypothetical protein
MGRRKQPKKPPLQGVVHLKGTNAFDGSNVQTIMQAVNTPSMKSAEWVSDGLNDATASYFAAFALLKTGTPSEQIKWVRELRLATELCLGMLSLGANGERPRCADHRVHSALFHWGEPDGVEFVPGPASTWEYDPVRDALDAIPGKLWDLRRMAAHAEERWRAAIVPRDKRHRPDRAVMCWVSSLANLYERIFELEVPEFPTPDSPFVRFADAARLVAAEAGATMHGTDAAARGRLGKLTKPRLASFMRENREELAERYKANRSANYEPKRIFFGITGEPDAQEESRSE